ncbi:MAG: enoyl-CoA hydratase/isomerase family protein [Candidatus Dormibacteraceae bacterium]
MTAEPGAPGHEELVTERRGAVQWVVFNRPQALNAITWNMYERLIEVCAEVDRDRDVRAMVLTGAGGRAFVAGTDIAQFRSFKTERDAIDYEATGNQVMSVLESVRVPTIAAIQGACTGSGAVMAACCDIRIGARSARYGIPIARTLGNCLSMPNYARMAAMLGAPRLKDLIMRARLLNADEMLAWGVVGELVADEDALAARAQELAEQLAARAPLTLWATKEALRRLRERQTPDGDGQDLIVACYLSRDFREGMEAFLAKRKPEWRGE